MGFVDQAVKSIRKLKWSMWPTHYYLFITPPPPISLALETTSDLTGNDIEIGFS